MADQKSETDHVPTKPYRPLSDVVLAVEDAVVVGASKLAGAISSMTLFVPGLIPAAQRARLKAGVKQVDAAVEGGEKALDAIDKALDEIDQALGLDPATEPPK